MCEVLSSPSMSDSEKRPLHSINFTDELLHSLMEQNIQLRQEIDKPGNALAIKDELIQQLRDEIAILKGQKPRPKIPPSILEGPGRKPDWVHRIHLLDRQEKTLTFIWRYFAVPPETSFSQHRYSKELAPIQLLSQASKLSRCAWSVIKKVRRTGKPGQPRGTRRQNKTALPIHQTVIIAPENVPEGAVFKGYRPYTVQDIIIQPCNTLYRIAQWECPDGSYIRGQVPQGVHGHYGPTLIAHIIHQYQACRVTEPLILAQLHAYGIKISAGQLSNILTQKIAVFAEEVAEILPAAIAVEGQVQVDDVAGRHQGQNQYTTVIGNRYCSVFTTTSSKSRINFLQLLQGGKHEYLINEDTVVYLQKKASEEFAGYIRFSMGSRFETLEAWKQFLKQRNITKENEVRFATEAALYASAIRKGIPRNLGVHGDDAGQFDVFDRSLCNGPPKLDRVKSYNLL